VHYKDLKTDVEHEIRTTLVADCGGAASKTSKLLKSQFGVNVAKSGVRSGINYVSCLFEMPKDNTYKFIYYQPLPPKAFVGSFAIKIKDNMWSVSLVSMNDTKLPKNLEGFLNTLKENKLDIMYDFCSRGKPTCRPYAFFKEGSEYHHFEKLSSLEGLVVLGDALTNFNPLYGQGLSTAAEGILLLDTMLWHGFDSRTFSSKYQQELCYKVSIPYLIATASDLRYPKTTGGTRALNLLLPLLDKMLTRMLYAGSKNKYAHRAFCHVVHMTEGFMWRFFDPRLIWNILFP